jgi:replication factor A1
MAYSMLSKLELGADNPRICVRVSRLWEFANPNDETQLLHLGLVLIDQEVSSSEHLAPSFL